VFQRVLTRFFGNKEDRVFKRFQPLVEQINQFEPSIQKLSDVELKSKTPDLRQQLYNGVSLNDLLPEAFAVVRETAVRALGQRHFDVQLIGGIALHQGSIAEMKTGEGKTLTSTLAVYLNALEGKGIHLATVNDYLAKRDAEWMGQIYNFLGLSVGLTVSGMSHEEKRLGYKSDITYGVHSEFGFDYLWGNKARHLEGKVQRNHNFAIIDEVDSVLIDEARVPLIIAEPHGEPVERYQKIRRAIVRLRLNDHYEIDEKGSKRGTVVLTDLGVDEVQRLLGVEDLYSHDNMDVIHHVNQALIAQALYKRDIDYVVKGGEVVIVDEFTGRMQEGRRYSEGLHQALEAKENVRIVQESQTGARISYQNYFRMYDKLSGMTGTAATEANEFAQIYSLDVVVVPTNRPMVRMDLADQIYKTEKAKFNAVITDILEKHEQGCPVLVGTISIENSEKLSRMLKVKNRNLDHQVLNAKEHAREATIIAQAGMPGAVTIATNMAGRGVDILLGGSPDIITRQFLRKRRLNPDATDQESEEWTSAFQEANAVCAENREKILVAGGLHIIGTERHESRRIDNQLRGRSGRQGDPGSSRFYLSLEDDLMRKFGQDRLQGMMDKVGMDDEIPIEHTWITKAIEKAQKRVEDKHFEIRKNLLKFDDVMTVQRQTIYSLRDEILHGDELTNKIWEMIENLVDDHLDFYLINPDPEEESGVEVFAKWLTRTFPIDLSTWLPPIDQQEPNQIRSCIIESLQSIYALREKEMGVEIMRELERMILLDRIDSHWKDHLYNIDYLEEGIHLRGYGGKDPIVVFKNEALGVFESMHQRIEEEVCEYVFKAQLNIESREEKRSRTPARPKDKKQAMPRRRATRSNRPKRRKR